MASTTAHLIVGSALALPALRCRAITAVLEPWKILVLSGALAAAPDLDLVGRRVSGMYSTSILSHRGLFHSPFFLILFSAVLAGIVMHLHSRSAFRQLWILWASCMVTHPLLDALTDGGRGVMLLLPFSRDRIFFPWRPIHTPPGIESLLSRAWILRSSEIPFCLTAALLGITGLLILRKTRWFDLRQTAQ